jgi:surface protein
MKLDFDICKGGRVAGKKIIGMRYNYKDIYSLIGNYNAYTVKIKEGGYATVNFDISNEYYYSAIDTYFDMGDGTRFYENVLSYTYKEPGEYLIITSARISRAGTSSPEVIAVNGIRRDTISLESAFEHYLHVKEFAPQNVKTTRVTTMKNMFRDCWYNPNRIYEETGYTSDASILVDFSKWDTSSVTDMSGMFSAPNLPYSYDCTFAPTGLKTSNVTNMSGMFYNYECNKEVNFDSFDTSNVTDMSEMFRGMYQSALDIGHFNTKNVTTFKNMFYESNFAWKHYYFDENNKLINIPVDFSKWDTSNATDMSGMFYGCKVESLDLNNWKVHNVTDMSNIFSSCKKLTSLKLSNWNTNNAINMNFMFELCESLTTLDLSSFRTSNVTNMRHMFFGCTELTSLNLSNFDTTNADVDYMLFNCYNLRELKLNNCSKSTIEDIITSANFPTDDIGVTKYIYCKRTNAQGLEDLLPSPWEFNYID